MKQFLIVLSDPTSNFIEELKDFANKLIPNIWSFLIQLAALLIIILAVTFLAYKPVRKILKERADYVEGNIKNSEKALTESEIKNNEANERIISSKKEAKKIIEKAEKDALEEKEQIIKSAKEEASAQFEKAKADIENEVLKAQDEIHKEIVDVAIKASEKVLEREVSAKDNEQMIDNFIKEIKK